VLIALSPIAFHVRGPLLGGEQFAFRDVAHYYFPLYRHTSAEWRQGKIPLWNLSENTGQPLAADSTAGVFYPGQIILLLPVPFDWAFTLHVVIHLALAALLMHWSARRFGYSAPAATLAALAYASGGYVLFQYCNMAYLIGAAWLPLGFLAGHQVIDHGDRRWLFLFAMSLALMVLGGDAQTAYHLALVTAGYSLYCWITSAWLGKAGLSKSWFLDSDKFKSPFPKARLRRWRFTKTRFSRIWHVTTRKSDQIRHVTSWGTGLVLAALLAAVQIGPSLEWARNSTRSQTERPLSVWHLLRGADRDVPLPERIRGLYASPTPGTHDADIYDFSVGPWRVAELLWPNFSGSYFPTHHRWTRPVLGEERIWNPSLYVGWLPLLLAIRAFFTRRAARHERWWGWLAVLCLLASFGKYGLVWALQGLATGCGLGEMLPGVGFQVGGVYWFLLVALPGYSSFRYPAKWLVLFSMAVSLLAAAGWDRFRRDPNSESRMSPRRWLLGSFFLSLLGLLLLLAFRTSWLDPHLPAVDPIFGPLQPTGVFRDIGRSFLQTMIFVLLAMGIIQLPRTGADRWNMATGLLLLTAIDITAANHWQIATIPRDAVPSSRTHELLAANRGHDEAGPVDSTARLYRGNPRGWRPNSWSVVTSTRRLEELVAWNRHTLGSKYGMIEHFPAVSLIESAGSMQAADYASLLRVARDVGVRRGDGQRELPGELLIALGTGWILGPRDGELQAAWQAAGFQRVSGMDAIENAELWKHPEPRPRGWLVHQWELARPLGSTSRRRRDAWTREQLFPQGELRKLAEIAMLELPEHDPIRTRLAQMAAMSREDERMPESCRLVKELPERLEFQVELQRPGLLIVSDLYYPGWHGKALYEDGSREMLPIVRANRTMRGVVLEKTGSQRVVLVYRPWLLYVCLLVSVGTWLTLVGWLVWNTTLGSRSS
jgi:hypothetical protein